MIKPISRYMALLIGAIVVIIGTTVFAKAGFLIIRPMIDLENVVLFGLWWLAISAALYHLSRLKNWSAFLIRAGTLLLLLIGMITMDSFMEMSDNPITIFLIITFWLYVFYLLAPTFFSRYKLAIIGVYILSFVFFVYFRFQNGPYEHDEVFIIPLLFGPIPLLVLLWGYEQWRQFQVLKTEKGKAELALLRNQMSPHFFFNTLNNLYSLTVNNSQQAPEVILKLSDIMRYTIYEGEKEEVLLSAEITYLQHYLELHEIRQHRGIDTRFETNVVGAPKIAPLLFIILLENAIKHGVESMVENAYVHISLSGDDTRIEFSIKNNFESSKGKSPEGIGLQNLKKRLAMLYPDRHTLTIDKTENTYRATLIIEIK